MKDYSGIIKELEAKKDIEGLKALRTCIAAQRNAEVAYSKYVFRKYSSEEIDHAWMHQSEAPEELTNAIVLIYCDELPDILLEWIDESIKQLCKRRSKMPTRKSKRRIITLRPINEETYSTQYEDHKLYWNDLLNNNLDNFY